MHIPFHAVCFAALLLTGCATKETIPVVHVAANASGIIADPPRSHRPFNVMSGTSGSPDEPSGVDIHTRSIRPVRRNDYRHNVPATGGIRIVSLEHADRYPGIPGAMRTWKRLVNGDWSSIDDARRILYHDQLDEIPRVNAGRDIHAKLHARTFSWGKAVLFITEYANGITGYEIGEGQLYLTVQGFTSDGRYAVNGSFVIDGPDRRNFPRKHFLGSKAHTTAEYSADNDLVAKWLTDQPDDAFDPSIRQYEEFLDALRIETPAAGPFGPPSR